MKKIIPSIVKTLGILMIAYAITKMANFGNMTGFTISNIVQNSQFYLMYLFLFFSGIMLFVSGDYLQEYLAAKEQESPSPSLEGKVQTEEERAQFKKRFSEGLLGKILGKSRVSRVEQDQGKYSSGSNYQNGDMTQEQKKCLKNILD